MGEDKIRMHVPSDRKREGSRRISEERDKERIYPRLRLIKSEKTPGKIYMRMNEILKALCGIRIQRSVYWFPSLEAALKFKEIFCESRIFKVKREIR